MNDYTPTKTGARIALNEMLAALQTDDSNRYWKAFETLSAMHNSLYVLRLRYATDLEREPEIRTFSEATGVTTMFDDLHNHRCDIDHPPCPACELLEEREHEREAGL